MKRCLLPLLLAGFLFSCSNDFEAEGAANAAPNGSGNPGSEYAVSVEEALANLERALQPAEGEATRSDCSPRRVGAVRTVKAGEAFASTRAEALPGVDDLFYVVEFENGEGSAVLSADRRMAPIYAILDETVLSPDDFAGAATRAETGDEVPADVKDYLVDLMKAAAYNDISAAGGENDGEGEDDGEDEDEIGGVVGSGLGGGFEKDPIFTITPSPMKDTEVQTVIVCKQLPLTETKWDQGSPFNDLCVDNIGRICPAGCVTIACAQIMFYNRTGSTVSVTGKTFDWGLLEEFKYGKAVQSAAAKDEMARFIKRVGSALCVKYTINGSSSTITRAEALFQHLNYKGADAAGFSDHIDIARNLIRKQLPFYLQGVSKAEPTGGHAWVVDGWNEHYTRIITKTLDKNGNVIDYEFTEGNQVCLMHCNFGWKGRCDGYYSTNLFDTSKYNYNIEEEFGDVPSANGSETYIFSQKFKFINYTK